MAALSMRWPRRLLLFLPPIVLLCITAVVYYPSLHYEFQFDDIANIKKHFQIRSHSLWEQFFKGPRWISYWLNSIYYTIDKFNPFYYRLGNLIIHSLNGILVFFILFLGLSKLRRSNFFKHHAFSISFLTALLFLLHPIQTQAVSYVIQGQLEGMAVLFILAISLCFILIATTTNVLMRYSLTVLLLILAAFSSGTKEIAIVSPLLLVLLDWFFVSQGDWKRLKKNFILHSLIFVVVGLCYFFLLKPAFFFELFGLQMKAKNNIGNIITSKPGEMITPWTFFISQFKVILHYFWVFLCPYGMSVEYDWKLCPSLFSFDCIVPFLVLLFMGYLLLRLWKKDKTHLILFGALWFIIMILPRSSIIPSAELMYDYKTYGASFGLFFIISCALIWLFRWSYVSVLAYCGRLNECGEDVRIDYQGRGVSICSFLSMVIMASLLGIGSYSRNKVWRSGLEFWGDILKKAPGKARAYNNYGVELSTKLKRFEESIFYFKKAIKMDHLYPDPCNNLAVAYANLSKIDEAISAVRQGLSIKSNYPEGYNNLASFLLMKKDYIASEKAAKAAIALRPWYGKAYLNLGRVYLELGKNEAALECFRNACTKADLDNEFGFSNYAQVAMNLQRYDEAVCAYQKLKMINPHNQSIDFNLANAYLLANQSEKAIRLYEALMRKNPRDARIVYNCAEAYFKSNNFKKALDYFNKLQRYAYTFPQVKLRIAECYNKLGNIELSQKIFRQIADDQRMPNELKRAAQRMLYNTDGSQQMA